MKRNVLFFSVSLIVLFSMLVSLTASTAQSPQPAAHLTTLNADMTSAEVVAALPRDANLVLQWATVGFGCRLESILYQQ